jgi:hypothetical protein
MAAASIGRPACTLAGPAQKQDRFLAALQLINSACTELAYHFRMYAPPALTGVAAEDWYDRGLEVTSHDDRGGVFTAFDSIKLAGEEASDRLFTQPQRVERNIAVMVLVDMSGSTKERINGVVRESRALLCVALEVLDDRYAIYGFAGFTQKHGELSRIKRFEEAYDHRVREHIIGVAPKDYTRMGAFVRHLTRKLLEQEVCARLLITLSDGRPGDRDG